MVEESRSDEKELAEAIHTGMRRRPEQAFGAYFEGRNSSCALGAAYDGLYRLPHEHGPLRPLHLERVFDCLENTLRHCPIDGCPKSLMLASVIVHLNDDHEWSREQIADWLQTIPAFKRVS